MSWISLPHWLFIYDIIILIGEKHFCQFPWSYLFEILVFPKIKLHVTCKYNIWTHFFYHIIFPWVGLPYFWKHVVIIMLIFTLFLQCQIIWRILHCHSIPHHTKYQNLISGLSNISYLFKSRHWILQTMECWINWTIARTYWVDILNMKMQWWKLRLHFCKPW